MSDHEQLPPASLPTTPGEVTNAMIHYYRAEMSRMNAWRSRLDLTTNWAITVVAAMLSVTLSTPTAHHGLVLFAMVIVTLLLGVEARRYRFFDVYRMRVRQFERHYFGQLFGPEAQGGPEPWLLMLAQDLRHPKISDYVLASFGAPVAPKLYLDVPDPTAGLATQDRLSGSAIWCSSRSPAATGCSCGASVHRADLGMDNLRLGGLVLRLPELRRIFDTREGRRRSAGVVPISVK